VSGIIESKYLHKNIIKATDLFEEKKTKNQPLFYIYDDGTDRAY